MLRTPSRSTSTIGRPRNLLDHQSEQRVVGVRVLELLTGGSAIGGDQLQDLGRLPDTSPIGRQALPHLIVIPVRDAAALAQQLADGRPVGVEVEVRREVIGGRVVEGQLPGLDHLHHLGCDHRLGDAGDTELIVDPYVSNAVRLARRPTPCAVGGHHRGGHPAFAGHVVRIAWYSAASRRRPIPR